MSFSKCFLSKFFVTGSTLSVIFIHYTWLSFSFILYKVSGEMHWIQVRANVHEEIPSYSTAFVRLV